MEAKKNKMSSLLSLFKNRKAKTSVRIFQTGYRLPSRYIFEMKHGKTGLVLMFFSPYFHDRSDWRPSEREGWQQSPQARILTLP